MQLIVAYSGPRLLQNPDRISIEETDNILDRLLVHLGEIFRADVPNMRRQEDIAELSKRMVRRQGFHAIRVIGGVIFAAQRLGEHLNLARPLSGLQSAKRRAALK